MLRLQLPLLAIVGTLAYTQQDRGCVESSRAAMGPSLIIFLFCLWLDISCLRQPSDDNQPKRKTSDDTQPKPETSDNNQPKRKTAIMSSANTKPKMNPLTPAQRAQATAANADSIFFKKLAAEIRLKIYKAIFSGEEYSIYLMKPEVHRRLFGFYKPDNAHVTAILQTCRQLRNEALQAFHQNIGVRLVHKEGLKTFLKLDNTLLDKGQLRHIVLASRVSHRHHLAQMIGELPKLQSLKVLRITDNSIENFRHALKVGLSRSVMLSSERAKDRDFSTRQLLLFCIRIFHEEHLAVRDVSMTARHVWNCELRFVCKLHLVVHDGDGDDEDAEYMGRAVSSGAPFSTCQKVKLTCRR